MGLHFRLEHANWLAHLIEPNTTLLPSLDDRARKDLVEFLRLFEYGFFSSIREDKVIELSQRVADEVERSIRVEANVLRPLRELFKDTLWVALLIPSGMDVESDSLLTHYDYLQKIVHGGIGSAKRIARVNPGKPGLILQLDEPPNAQSLILNYVFPAFRKALAESTRWPGVLVWTRENEALKDAEFFPLPKDTGSLDRDLRWIIDRLEGDDTLRSIKDQYRERQAPPFRIIHLSDLHLGSTVANERIHHVKDLIRNVTRELEGSSTIVPLVTGDLMDTPSKENLNLVRDFVGFLRDLRVSEPITLIGNHDVRKAGLISADLQHALALPRVPLVWFDDCTVGLLCFDSLRGGDFAGGRIGDDQLMEMGDLLDREPEKSENYTLIAALHHHPIPVDASQWLHNEWYESLLGNWVERTMQLEDADKFNYWLKARNCVAALHGHKHIPRADLHNNISYLGCGSTVGKVRPHKGQTHISINVVTIEPHRGRLSCRLLAEKIPGAGLAENDAHELLYRNEAHYATH